MRTGVRDFETSRLVSSRYRADTARLAWGCYASLMTPIAIQSLDLPAEAQRIHDAAHRMDEDCQRPALLAIVGTPGSGKSTLARQVVDAVNQQRPNAAILLPMDGYHYPNAVLKDKGLRDRKGAPETFDVVGFMGTIQAIHREDYPVRFPIYDRQLHDPVMRDDPEQTVLATHELVVVEGNYLLLDREPWVTLHPLWDETWFIDCPWPVARQRLIDRHIVGGMSAADAEHKADTVDHENAELIKKESAAAARVIEVSGE